MLASLMLFVVVAESKGRFPYSFFPFCMFSISFFYFFLFYRPWSSVGINHWVLWSKGNTYVLPFSSLENKKNIFSNLFVSFFLLFAVSSLIVVFSGNFTRICDLEHHNSNFRATWWRIGLCLYNNIESGFDLAYCFNSRLHQSGIKAFLQEKYERYAYLCCISKIVLLSWFCCRIPILD